MGGYKSKYYINLDDQDCATHDAEKLKKSMAGLGTDEANLIRLLAFKNNDHLSRVARVFNEKFGKNGDLVQWIKDDTSGDFKRIATAMAKEEAEMIADALYKAMKGMGTDDDLLINTLCTRSPIQIEKAKAIFERKYPGENLVSWISNDTSGDYKKILLALIDKKAYFCERIHEAIAGMGTYDDDLIRIISSLKHHDQVKKIVSNFSDPYGFSIDLTTELEMEFSTPTLKEVAETYEKMYNVSLKSAVASDVSGNYGKLLLGLLEDQAERDADYIRKACVGMGTNDDNLIELLVTRGERERQAIGEAFVRRYGTTLEDQIKSETSFNYKQTLTALARPKARTIAMALQKSMEGMGTDDRGLVSLMVHRSKQEIRDICKQYETLYQRELKNDVASETSGWYQKTLLFLINEATNEKKRGHVPWSSLSYVRDVDR